MVEVNLTEWFKEIINSPGARAEYLAMSFITDAERLRQEQHLTYAELARRMGVSRAYIAKVMSGTQNSTLGSLVRLAEALGAEVTLGMKVPAKEKRKQLAVSPQPAAKRTTKATAPAPARRRKVG